MSRHVYRAEIEIAASAAKVWGVLVDLDHYSAWNRFTVSMRSRLVVGEPIDMRVHMSRWRLTLSQRETVREVLPPGDETAARLVWGMRMPGIVAERVQTVTPLSADSCRYVTEDTIEGPLGGLVALLFAGSLDDGFAAVAHGLATRAARSPLD